jgi:Zn-dependent protease with chaperone function
MNGPLGVVVQALLAVLTLSVAESGLESETPRPWIVPLLFLVPHALALAGRAALGARARSLARLRTLVALSPFPLYIVATVACGWRLWVFEGLAAEASSLAFFGVLVALAPYAVLAVAAIDAAARLSPASPKGRRALRSFQLRMLLLAALPLAAFVIGVSLLSLSERLRLEMEGVSLWGALFFAVFLGLFLRGLPAFLRRIWACEPLPAGPLRARLEELARVAGFRYRELCLWNTGGLMPNAMIAGVWPRSRVVLLTDVLLSILDPEEVQAVFAHEMGHAKKGHALLFLAMTCATFMTAHLLAMAIDPSGGWVALGVAVPTFIAWAVAFGWISRRIELDADLYCHELTGSSLALQSAFARLGGGERSSWRHFSAPRRVAFLQRAAVDPTFVQAFRRRLRRVAVASVTVFCVAGALQAGTVLTAFPAERVAVELSLGRHAHAAARARGIGDLPEESARLLATITAAGAAIDHADRAAAAAACGQHAARALEEREWAAARDWLRLAELAGNESAGRCALALELGREERWEDARAALEGDESAPARSIARWLTRAARSQ